MMDAKKIKDILNEVITTVTPRPQDLEEDSETWDLLHELDSSRSTPDDIVLTTEDGRRFRVVLSVVEMPSG